MILRRITGRAPAVIIEYTDSAGEQSVRQIAPLAIGGKLNGSEFLAEYVIARCKKARAQRTFRCERIDTIADAKSGELIGLARWLQSLDLAPIEPYELGDELSEPPAEPVQTIVRRGFRLRWVLIALLVGYAIGRWRIIRLVAIAMHWSWGRPW